MRKLCTFNCAIIAFVLNPNKALFILWLYFNWIFFSFVVVGCIFLFRFFRSFVGLYVCYCFVFVLFGHRQLFSHWIHECARIIMQCMTICCFLKIKIKCQFCFDWNDIAFLNYQWILVMFIISYWNFAFVMCKYFQQTKRNRRQEK